MKIFLDENFSIASVTDDVGQSIVRGSEAFDKLYVYIPTAQVNSYTSVSPLYSVKRADGRELGRYATLTNSDSSVSGYYGYYGSFNAKDISVAGALEITITLQLTNATGRMYKNVAKVTTNVKQGVAVDDDVFVIGDGSVYTSLKASLDALTSSYGSKADRNNANQTIVAGIVQASSITKGGVSVATVTDVSSAVATETTNRQNADTTLQNNIDAEATARANADALKVNISDVINNLTDTSTNKPLSAYQGKILKDLITSIQTLLASDDTTLDEIQEIVDYIKANRDLIESITSSQVSVSDIIDNLTSAVSNKPLSAKQGYILKGLLDSLTEIVSQHTTKLANIEEEATKVEASETNGNIKINNVETTVYTLPKATANILGGVKIGNYINVDENGVISISLASASNDGLLTQAQYSKLQEIINYSLSITVGEETTTYTTIPTIINAVYSFLDALQDEVAALEGSDTTFSERIVAIEEDLSALQTAWNTFMAGTDADNITDTLISVQTNVATLQSDVSTLQNTITTMQGNISTLQTDVSNIKEELQDETITSSGEAYSVDTTIESWGTIDKIGGMSYKCNNLFNVNNVTLGDLGDTSIQTRALITVGYFSAGFTFTYNIGGSYLASAVLTSQPMPTSSSNLLQIIYNGITLGEKRITYTLSQAGYLGFIFANESDTASAINLSTLKSTINLMLNAGSTALPYEEYFSGLRNGAVTSVESVNENLIQEDVYKNNTWEIKLGYVELKANVVYNLWTDVSFPSGQRALMKNGTKTTIGDYIIAFDGYTFSGNNYFSLTSDYSGYIWLAGTFTNVNPTKAMLNKGSSALTYVPHETSTLEIPSGVQALTGYGMGVNSSVYNYIEFDYANKKAYFVRNVASVDLGSLSWSWNGSFWLAPVDIQDYCIVVCDTLTATRKQAQNLEDGELTTYWSWSGSTPRILAKNGSSSTAPSGTLVYPLATPTKVDISSYFDFDVIKLFKNGSVTFNNTYNYAVPYQFTYASTMRDLIMLNYENDKKQQREIEELQGDTATLETFKENLPKTFISNFMLQNGKSLKPSIKKVKFEEITWNGLSAFEGENIWTDGNNIYYSYRSIQFRLNIFTNTWEEMTWGGVSELYAQYIWTDGNNIYYSYGTTQLVLSYNNAWVSTTWSGLNDFYGNGIWSDGTNIYYSNYTSNVYNPNWVLNVSTKTWAIKTWNGAFTELDGWNIWTDGTNFYHSTNNGAINIHYKLDTSTSTWERFYFTADVPTTYIGKDVWTDGKNIYCSNYVLDVDTATWSEITLENCPQSSTSSYGGGSNVWTDGINIYYSYNLRHYRLVSFNINLRPVLKK